VRELHPDFLAEVRKKDLSFGQLVWLDILPDPVGFWSGAGEINFDSRTFHGSERASRVETIREVSGIVAGTVRMSLTLTKDAEDLAFLRTITVTDRPVEIYDAVFSSAGTLLAVDSAFKGTLSDLQLRIGPRYYELSVTGTNSLVNLKRTSGLSHGYDDQRRTFSGDTSARFLPFFQDVNFRL
jgi:hypothetical protein